MTRLGEIYLELYLAEPSPDNHVGLYRSGTRVVEEITQLEQLRHSPWTAGYLQGIVDVPFLNLTPGTRTGIIHDEAFAAFCVALAPVETAIQNLIDAQKRAEEEHTSAHMLRTIQRAFKAARCLPRNTTGSTQAPGDKRQPSSAAMGLKYRSWRRRGLHEAEDGVRRQQRQKQFFEFAGPLYSVRISPASCVVRWRNEDVARHRRDRSRHGRHDLRFRWEIMRAAGPENAEGGGHLPCSVRPGWYS